ncbi:hypothetical protein CONPUDRAFT_137845 [Coniophora puteana RWD-64-598 SS2]|uniref:Uncharacterized protein n=1 Tax=Coniophora puteana (strain RWD-64-598) TaxID=741705 RepID=A0A5M3MLP4_CONPW|nr:uncharacterized protein CONPUDRAFT_137845 [Coniophora puteana RWD-64-598 SS2]EIW79491.1 hypothetical protein CONPUDRAFT_137845 [Coniophora puteana RWD-64-598 SS2]
MPASSPCSRARPLGNAAATSTRVSAVSMSFYARDIRTAGALLDQNAIYLPRTGIQESPDCLHERT